ncbi:MAG: hypothetical protein RPR97_08310 [Colwellia sp.]
MFAASTCRVRAAGLIKNLYDSYGGFCDCQVRFKPLTQSVRSSLSHYTFIETKIRRKNHFSTMGGSIYFIRFKKITASILIADKVTFLFPVDDPVV